MTNGAKPIAVVVTDRFEAPKPTYQAPQNADYMKQEVKDNTPAKSLLQKAKEEGNDKLVQLLEKAEASAKAAVERAKAKSEGRKLPSTPTKRKEKKSEPVKVQVGHFNPEDVCDDRTFVIRTRSSDIHTEEMKRLFWANGGEKFMKVGLGYASAFSNLRQEKIKAIQKK